MPANSGLLLPCALLYIELMKKPLFLLVFLAFAAPAFAFNQPTELCGITTVNVTVADLPRDLTAKGVTKDALAASLEAALQKAGISVLPSDSRSDTVPTISLRMTAVGTPNGRFFATDIVLECLDNVSSRRTAGEFEAVIWSNDVLQLLGEIDLSRITQGEQTLVGLFLRDYRQSNPK